MLLHDFSAAVFFSQQFSVTFYSIPPSSVPALSTRGLQDCCWSLSQLSWNERMKIAMKRMKECSWENTADKALIKTLTLLSYILIFHSPAPIFLINYSQPFAAAHSWFALCPLRDLGAPPADSFGVWCLLVDAAEVRWSGLLSCRMWQEETRSVEGMNRPFAAALFLFLSGKLVKKFLPCQDHLLRVYLLTLNFLLLSDLNGGPAVAQRGDLSVGIFTLSYCAMANQRWPSHPANSSTLYLYFPLKFGEKSAQTKEYMLH